MTTTIQLQHKDLLNDIIELLTLGLIEDLIVYI